MKARALLRIVVLGLLGFTAAATASSPPIVNETTITREVTDTRYEVDPCLGLTPNIITTSYTTRLHFTQFADGTYHVSGGENGTYFNDRVDPSLPDISGRFNNSFARSGVFTQGTDQPRTFTLRFVAVGLDTVGARTALHGVQHITVTPDGEVRTDIIRISCSSN